MVVGVQMFEKIVKSGSIMFGFCFDLVLFLFVGLDWCLVGFLVDLCQWVVVGFVSQFKLFGFRMEWVLVSVQDCIEQVIEGQVDFECGIIMVMFGCQWCIDFSLIIFLDGGVFLVCVGGVVLCSLQDLCGVCVGVSVGIMIEKVLCRMVVDSGLVVEVVLVVNYVDGVNLLFVGKVVMYVVDCMVLIGLVMNVGCDKLQLFDFQFFYEFYVLVMCCDVDFCLVVNCELVEVFCQGEIVVIYCKWFGQFGELQELFKVFYIIQLFQEQCGYNCFFVEWCLSG